MDLLGVLSLAGNEIYQVSIDKSKILNLNKSFHINLWRKENSNADEDFRKIPQGILLKTTFVVFITLYIKV